MSFEKLIQIDVGKKDKLTSEQRGCDYCPAQRGWRHGLEPIMGKVKGRRLFIIAQNPGKQEIKEGKELKGPTGQMLWNILSKYGVRRKDCDIQNAVRCMTYEKDELGYRQPRTPDKIETHCCSLHTENALKKSRAKAYLILGQLAARQVLGREYSKGKKVFYSERLEAWVICTDHPAFFLRGGSKQRFEEFKESIRVAAKKAFGKKIKSSSKGLDKFQILLEQDYRRVLTYREAKRAYRDILFYAERKRRIAADIETDKVNDKKVMLSVAFCPKPGLAYTFILDHPANTDNPERKAVKRVVIKMMRDKRIRKVFHHGCSDVPDTYATLGCRVKSYDFDSEYGAYFHDSSLKKYGLMALSDRWFPEFSGYKEITMPYALPEGVEYKKGRKLGMLHYSQVPIKRLVLYNAADADLSKRIEIKTRESVKLPLMHLYQDVAFVFDKMQHNGPLIDYKYHALLSKIYPVRRKESLEQLKELALKYWKKHDPRRDATDEKHLIKLEKLNDHIKKGTFNPKSVPNQLMPLMYDCLRFEPPTAYVRGKEVELRNTRATTLELLQENYPKHPWLTTLGEFRENDSISSKGLKSFKHSADLNDGRLRTNWWLTGTITGRLRSGGSQEGEDAHSRGIINLQNIPRNKTVQNMIISDNNWYDLKEEWVDKVLGPFKHRNEKWRRLFEIDEKSKKYTDRAIDIRNKLIDGADFDWEQYENMYTFMAFDYSQIEVRVLAQMSEDPKLCEYFERGIDIHCGVGHELTGWDIDRIKNDKDMRAACKAIHFAIIYGKQHRGLYEQLRAEGVKISFDRVGELLEGYWKKFKRVKHLMDGFREMADDKGYVETMFGFRRPIGGDEDRSSFTGNQAINSPIQGSAHQLVLMAIALLNRRSDKYSLLQDIQMEVHDAIYWRLKIKKLERAAKMAYKLLEHDVLDVVKNDFGIKWKVPLLAEGDAGLRLGTMIEVKKDLNVGRWVNEWALTCEERDRGVWKELLKVAA